MTARECSRDANLLSEEKSVSEFGSKVRYETITNTELRELASEKS